MSVFINQLKKEHQTIRTMNEIAKKMCQKCGQAEKVNSVHIDRVIEFFDVFIDQCHERKEENGLLPALENAEVLENGKSVGSLISDHITLRTYLKKMKENHFKFKDKEHQGVSGVVAYILNYIDFFSRHMEKEEKVFYEIADQTLSEEAQRELYHRFESIDSIEIGKEKIAALHGELAGLSEIYLK